MIRKVILRGDRSACFSGQVVVIRQNTVLQNLVGLLLLLLANPCLAHPQPSENTCKVTATTDRTEVQIADPFQLTIQVTAPQDTQISFPEFPKTVGAFEVLEQVDRFNIADLKNPAVRTWTKQLALETLETGQLRIPAIEITASKRGESSQILRTTPMEIVVASVVEGSADLTSFQDIADLHDVQSPDGNSFAWGWWLAGGGAALALVVGGAFLTVKRRQQPGAVASWATQKLDALADEDFLQSESILRTFIAERFEFPAESYPSNEITQTLQRLGVAEDCLACVSDFFGKTERIKFGGQQSPPPEAVALVASARDLIQKLNQPWETN